jgi:hypothetical protein
MGYVSFFDKFVRIAAAALRMVPLSCGRALHHEIRPPTPRSEPTARAVTWGDIKKQAATVVVALLVEVLLVRTIGYN